MLVKPGGCVRVAVSRAEQGSPWTPSRFESSGLSSTADSRLELLLLETTLGLMHEPANSRLECPGYFTKEQPEEGPKKNNPMYDRSLLSL